MKVISVFHHERRLCACGCGRYFKPTDIIGPDSTERFIDAYHAVGPRSPLYLKNPDVERRAKQKLLRASRPVAQDMNGGTLRRAPRPAVADATTEARFGPVVQVALILEVRKSNRRVRLSCKHEKTIGLNSKTVRCFQCRVRG